MAFSVSCYIYKMVLDSGLSDKELMDVILDEDTTKYIEKEMGACLINNVRRSCMANYTILDYRRLY